MLNRSKGWADIRTIKQQEKLAKKLVTFFAFFVVFIIYYSFIKTIIQL